eukprot:5579934-Amphidinium_carterae.2
MDSHILKCAEAKKAGAVPTGQSAALERRLKSNKERQEKGHPPDSDKPLGASGSSPSEFAESDDVRVECQVCGRKFAFDRVAKHQAICTKINNKKPRKPYEVKRTYNEGGSSGAVIGVSAPPVGKGGRGKVPVGCEANLASKPNPKPPRSRWREESRAFREACKAGWALSQHNAHPLFGDRLFIETTNSWQQKQLLNSIPRGEALQGDSLGSPQKYKRGRKYNCYCQSCGTCSSLGVLMGTFAIF